ncbi:MAG: PGPGW domain-containing protein [Candidatus Saccharibacteria bacterium]
MNQLRRHAVRIATDAAGYGLIILGLAIGWLPGPGGIPLTVAGLGLLSINNVWAERLRTYLLARGGKAVGWLFPDTPLAQWLYDLLVLALLGGVAGLAYHHNAVWQISLATIGFFIALAIAFLNRGRYERLKRKHK